MNTNPTAPSEQKFQPIEGIVKKTSIAIWVNVVALIFVTPLSLYVLSLPEAKGDNVDPMQAVAALVMIVAIAVQIISLLTAGIMFLMWNYRAYINSILFENPHADQQKLKSAAVDVVGGWLIPIYNLYKPFQVMSILWETSAPKPRSDAELAAKPRIPVGMRIWWGAWLIGLVIDRADQAMKGNGTGVIGSVASLAAHIVAGYLAVRLINAITERQVHKIHMLASADATTPQA